MEMYIITFYQCPLPPPRLFCPGLPLPLPPPLPLPLPLPRPLDECCGWIEALLIETPSFNNWSHSGHPS